MTLAPPRSWYRRRGKRWLDALCAGVGLLTLAPLLALTAGLVRWRLGSPILFVQERPGLHGRPFRVIKFRTMTGARDESGRLLSDEARLTSFGRRLRAWSLDELPELVNVLRGEMSVVGPRPLLMAYLPRYTPSQARRHETRPGLTGWAQVHGRNALAWNDRLTLDTWYVDHVALALDLRIMIRTVALVISGAGIQAPDHATMPEFPGSGTEAAGLDTTGIQAAGRVGREGLAQ